MKQIIKKAREFATKAHEGQFRKDGITPFINHPEAVYNLLLCAGVEDENMLCAAWLHDVVEDCGIKIDEIIEFFNFEVASIVFSLTKEDSREEYHKKIIDSSEKVKMIKLADTIHNSSVMYFDHISEEYRNKKIGDSIKIYLPMAKEIYKPFYYLLKFHVDKRKKFYKKRAQN